MVITIAWSFLLELTMFRAAASPPFAPRSTRARSSGFARSTAPVRPLIEWRPRMATWLSPMPSDAIIFTRDHTARSPRPFDAHGGGGACEANVAERNYLSRDLLLSVGARAGSRG